MSQNKAVLRRILSEVFEKGRLEVLEKSRGVGDVLRMKWRLGDGAGPVKAQVHEAQLLRWNTARQRCSSGFRLSDQAFDLEDVR